MGRLLESSGASVRPYSLAEVPDASFEGLERIIVAGGDGSIAPAARAAVKAELPLGVVPAGTANDFADRMGLPCDVREATMLALLGKRTREVDLAEAGGLPFVNVASIGLAPAAARRASGMKGLLGPLAYSVGAMRAAASAEPCHCVVRCGGEVLLDGAAWQVTVACSGAFGGGSRLETDADDGELDVVVIESGPRRRLLKHAAGLKAGRIEGNAGVLSSRCSRIEIEIAAEQELNVDGELVRSERVLGESGSIAFTVCAESVELVRS